MASKTKEGKYCRIIIKKSLHKFRELTIGKFLTNVIKIKLVELINNEVWQNERNKLLEKCFNIKKNKKQRNKRIKNLYQIKRKIKRIYLVKEPRT